MQETWVWFLGQKDLLEKKMVTHSSILAWRIPWTEEPGRLHTVCGVVRVRHDLVIKPPLQTLRSFKWNKGSFFSAQAPWESRDLVLQRCLEMLMLMVEHVTLSDTGSENQGGRGRETPFSVSLRIYSIFWTPCHQRILIFPVWGGEMCRRDLNIQSLDSTLNN